jgi:hypothetical protein
MYLWFYLAFTQLQSILTAPWQGITAYSASFRPGLFLAWIMPAFLLAPIILTMMVCLHEWVPKEKQTWSFLALVFTAVYVAVLTPFYYIQMTVITFNLGNVTTEGLSLWLHAYYYPYNIAGALEAVGYGFVSISFLLVSFVFGKEKLQQWLRWTFVGVGLTGLSLFIDPLFRLPMVFLIVDAVANSLLGIIAPVLMSIVFRRKESGSAVATPS